MQLRIFFRQRYKMVYKYDMVINMLLFADVWQKINNDLVSFGARDDRYGAFNVT